jgi:hypothetical protein
LRLRELWLAGGSVVGGWLMIGSAFAAEFAASLEVDYLVVGCQHGVAGYQGMVEVLGVVGKMGPAPLVRSSLEFTRRAADRLVSSSNRALDGDCCLGCRGDQARRSVRDRRRARSRTATSRRDESRNGYDQQARSRAVCRRH